MTQEEKAKRYDELLLKLQKAKVDDNVCDEMYYRVINDIVPELKESEDERIRKEIIATIHLYYGEPLEDEAKEMIAWLESQGEQKQDPCEHCDDKRLNCHNFPCVKKRAFEQGKSVLEVIKEEPQVYDTDDGEIITHSETDGYKLVGPKFKKDDWVVNKFGDVWHIDSFDKKNYQVSDGKGNYNYFPISRQDKMRLYTIEDAKDGNVLNSPSHHLIWIYKDNGHFYACENMNYVTEKVATDGLIRIPKDACPATKEQRKQLKKAMVYAGYTFDFEKKELKELVEQLKEK